jgi:hypothetical protein
MLTALMSNLEAIDKVIVTIVTVALVGLIHAVAYTAAQGSLRTPRIMLGRAADLLAVGAALFVIRVWTL